MVMLTPRRQRLMQQIMALRPEQRAVVGTVFSQAEGEWADEDMRNRIQSMQAASRETNMDRSLDLGEKRLALREKSLGYNKELSDEQLALSKSKLGLRQQAYDFGLKQDRAAETLGWLNLGASGLTGLGEYAKGVKQAEELQQMQDLYKASMEDNLAMNKLYRARLGYGG